MLQYFCSLEHLMETFSVDVGDDLMAVFGYICELITQLKRKQQEI